MIRTSVQDKCVQDKLQDKRHLQNEMQPLSFRTESVVG